MPSHILMRTLAIALTVGALAAPAAVAKPVDGARWQQAREEAAAWADPVQRDAASDIRTSAYPSGKPDASEAYSSSDGTPWTTIALGVGGALLLIAVLAVARRTRPRTHVAA